MTLDVSFSLTVLQLQRVTKSDLERCNFSNPRASTVSKLPDVHFASACATLFRKAYSDTSSLSRNHPSTKPGDFHTPDQKITVQQKMSSNDDDISQN
jgi:hypothetical protein